MSPTITKDQFELSSTVLLFIGDCEYDMDIFPHVPSLLNVTV